MINAQSFPNSVTASKLRQNMSNLRMRRFCNILISDVLQEEKK